MSATFTKGERLCAFREIDHLLKKGENFFHYPFKVVHINVPAEEASPKALNAIMVSVPKKNFKRAVKRNLLKRRIRESYRLNKDRLTAPEGYRKHVLFVYISKEVREFSFIEERMKEVLTRISAPASEDRK